MGRRCHRAADQGWRSLEERGVGICRRETRESRRNPGGGIPSTRRRRRRAGRDARAGRRRVHRRPRESRDDLRVQRALALVITPMRSRRRLTFRIVLSKVSSSTSVFASIIIFVKCATLHVQRVESHSFIRVHFRSLKPMRLDVLLGVLLRIFRLLRRHLLRERLRLDRRLAPPRARFASSL